VHIDVDERKVNRKVDGPAGVWLWSVLNFNEAQSKWWVFIFSVTAIDSDPT